MTLPNPQEWLDALVIYYLQLLKQLSSVTLKFVSAICFCCCFLLQASSAAHNCTENTLLLLSGSSIEVVWAMAEKLNGGTAVLSIGAWNAGSWQFNSGRVPKRPNLGQG